MCSFNTSLGYLYKYVGIFSVLALYQIYWVGQSFNWVSIHVNPHNFSTMLFGSLVVPYTLNFNHCAEGESGFRFRDILV